MSTDKRHAEFDISYIENDQINIEMDGCSIVTEYLEDKDARRTTMGPANIFFAAFALWACTDILAFCRKRNISSEGFKIRQIVDWNRQHTDNSRVLLRIELPDHFPRKYDNAIGKAVDSCLVVKLGKDIHPDSFARDITRSQK